MAYWLMKSEPYVFSWSQLLTDGTNDWNGVRNHTAKRNLQAMQVGDLAFFYHSNEGVEIVGVMEITKTAHPDLSDASGKFVQVTVKPIKPLKKPVTLKQIKADPALAEMVLVKQSRLSVQPVTPDEWAHICQLGGV